MVDVTDVSLKSNDYSKPVYLDSQFSKKHFRFLADKIKSLSKPVTILDIGGTAGFWAEENYHQKEVLITILNHRANKSHYSNMRVIAGDACNLAMFRDHTFDITFSNSLIEHLCTKENQIKMASEAIRVGKYFLIQTPNRYFPIEPHFKFLFFQFLPKWLKIFLQTKTSWINGVRYDPAYAKNVTEAIRLLSKKELKQLFPNSKLYVERFLGLAKSFVAYNIPAEQTD